MERSPTAQQTVQDQLEGPLWRYTENTLCKENHPAGYLYFCMRSSVAAPDLILLGDSYANHLYAGIIKNDQLSHHSVLSYGACNFDLIPTTKIGCDAQDELIKNTPTLRYAILNNWWGVADENGHFSYVLDNIKHTSNSELNKELLIKKLNERILLLKSKNIKVVIFEPKPILEYDIKACFARPFKKPAKDCVISQDSVKKQQEDLLSVFVQIKKLHPDVGVFEQNTLFVEDDSFRTIKNGMPLLRDNGHYSVYGSIEIMKKFTSWAELNMPEILH
jgi:SGNH domain (fused to AT3 domains)